MRFNSHGPGVFPQPDQHVQSIENETLRTRKPANSASMPQRPGYGTQGRSITLWANYFEMKSRDDLLVYRYSIEIQPDARGKTPVGKKLKRLIEVLLEEHFPAYRTHIATDYKSTVISRIDLPNLESSYSVVYRAEFEDEPGPRAVTYRLRLQNNGTVRVSELLDYLTSTQASAVFGSKDEIIQALNIIVGHHPKTALSIFSIGANKHFELHPARTEKMSLGSGLEAVRGFFVSVRAATARILVNIQVKHAACYLEGPLVQLMAAYLHENNDSMAKLEHFLKKVRVQVKHIVRKNKMGQDIPRIKTVEGLARQGDGHGLPNPPIVPRFAAGARDVKFYLGNPGEQPGGGGELALAGNKGRKKGKLGPQPPQTGYISVFDFFQRSECL
jgi:eukaryotic translation initiation factor 2C